MKQHRVLNISLSLCGWVTFPVMTLGYALGWPSAVQTVIAIPLLVLVVWSEIVDHSRWTRRFERARTRWRRSQYCREARKTK